MKNIKSIALSFGVLALLLLVGVCSYAWTEPTGFAPSNNVPAPVNVGPIGQSKSGGLILNTGGAETGLMVPQGKVLIGYSGTGGNYSDKLAVNGAISASSFCIGTSCISTWPSSGGSSYPSPSSPVSWLDNSGMYIYPSNYSMFVITSQGNVGIGTTMPMYKLDVEGSVQANMFYTGDIKFQKDNKVLWRMYEDEDGLYLESSTTGKHYKMMLEEIK